MNRALSIVVIAVVSAGTACSNNNENSDNNRITFDRDQGSNVRDTGGTTVDMGNSDVGESADMAQSDASTEIDFTVQAEGVMHGRWTATRDDGGAEIVKLHLRHEAGESGIIGTFEMTMPAAASGLVGGSNYLNDTFTTSWNARIDSVDRQFGLTGCASTGEGVFACDHNDPLTGSVVAATLTKD